MDDVCFLDAPTRSVLECDIHNGLTNWRLTELTLVVTWFPYGDADKNYYRIPVSTGPLTTAHVTVRIGIILPIGNHWSWQTVSARGQPAK